MGVHDLTTDRETLYPPGPTKPAIYSQLTATGGGEARFPPGVYVVSQAITLSGASAVALVGAGASARGSNTSGTHLLASGRTSVVVLEGCTHVQVRSMTLTQATANASVLYTPTPPPAALVVGHSFWVTVEHVSFDRVWAAVLCNASNTLTIADVLVEDVAGAAAFDMGAVPGERTDIVQMTRITTNQVDAAVSNASVVWISMGLNTNTLRLDNVGLINGGVGVRLDSVFPAGVAFPATTPGANYPLFLFANDLEIDFPKQHGVALATGRVAILTNSYLQGAGSGSGVFVGLDWTAELQISNSRIYGNAQDGVRMAGGQHATLANNIIGDNSQAAVGGFSGIAVETAVSNYAITGNRCGAVGEGPRQAHGIAVAARNTTIGVVSSNVCSGNLQGGTLVQGGGQGLWVSGNVGGS